jgi:hypothetical protein
VSGYREAKAAMRQSVHDAMAVAATYLDATMTEAAEITVRWHERGQVIGDLGSQGYAQIIENYNVLVFDRVALSDAGVVLRRGGIVTLTEEGLAFQLDTARQIDGPVEVLWNVLIPTSLA